MMLAARKSGGDVGRRRQKSAIYWTCGDIQNFYLASVIWNHETKTTRTRKSVVRKPEKSS